MSHLSLAIFNILFLSLSLDSVTVVCQGVDLFDFVLLVFIELLGSADNFFHQNWEVSSHYFFMPLSLSSLFLDSHCIYVGTLDSIPQVSDILFVFLHSFLLCFSNLLISIDLYSSLLILSSVKPSLSNIFISVIILLNSKITIFLIVSISLLTFYIWLYIIFIFSFTSLDMVSFSYFKYICNGQFKNLVY